jgi:hypothetical protein
MTVRGRGVLLTTWCALLVSVFVPAKVRAQSPPAAPETIPVGDWQLAPMLQLRTRGEVRHNPVDVGGGPAAPGINLTVIDSLVLMERARVGLGAEHGPIRAQVTLQDARAWGAIAPSATLPGGQPPGVFGAYEAYAELHTSAARPSFVRVGRQAVTWGEGRLVSAALVWSSAYASYAPKTPGG